MSEQPQIEKREKPPKGEKKPVGSGRSIEAWFSNKEKSLKKPISNKLKEIMRMRAQGRADFDAVWALLFKEKK